MEQKNEEEKGGPENQEKEIKEEIEGKLLLGKPKFKKLENGRYKCVETGHEMPADARESYAHSKHCRLGLINSAMAHKTPPLNMFHQDPHSRLRLICSLTGDAVNKTEEHIWKHINGQRFLYMLDMKKKGASEFKNFGIASDYSDHHYVNYRPRKKLNKSSEEKLGAVSSENKHVYKKIMKEWKILEERLPESIYVRVYEERIDLLRAAIVGASGTPYHDGLFFFDIYLPSDYPDKPPKVYYHSHGLRLNPSLYSSGYVRLSLWSRSKDEKWTLKRSSILQLLLSIQGLVLNAEPYFNEPEHKHESSLSHKLSAEYNAEAFLLSCHAMIHTMHKPPQNFEAIVKEHFRRRGKYILESFKAYQHGLAAGGCSQNVGPSSSSSLFVDVKDKFTTSKSKKLFTALEKWLFSLTQASEEEDDNYLDRRGW